MKYNVFIHVHSHSQIIAVFCVSIFFVYYVYGLIMCTALPTLHFLFFQRHIHLRTAPNQELTAAAAVATAAKYLKTPNYRTARVQ